MAIENTFLTATTECLPLAHFILANNQPETRSCLQIQTAPQANGLAAEMAELLKKDELLFVLARENSQLLGCLGCEFDRDSARGWLRGPLLTGGADFSLAETLLQQVLLHLPSEIQRVDAFIHSANPVTQAFYRQQGFQRIRAVYVYQASKANPMPPSAISPCITLQPQSQPDLAEQFCQLHDQIFPQVYISGHAILTQLDDTHRIELALQTGQVVGYCYHTADFNAQEGYIEYLGVAPAARGQGWGQKLLSSALNLHFNHFGLEQTSLTVDEENSNAQSLYERVGFRLETSGVNWRKELGEPA
ncbi:MAG TPA: N-acetyltransferase [Anaerolineales bacterium]|nr:N-acetyltransferase [Anaerolineales bacterium]